MAGDNHNDEGRDKQLRDQLQRVAGLVREVDEITDLAARSVAKQLVQVLVELHGEVLERMLEKTFAFGETGVRIIDELGADPLAGGLLAFYGLHPQDLETRVVSTVERLVTKLQSQGVKIEVASIFEGEVCLRVSPGSHTCGSTAAAIKSEIEDAIYTAAPDINSLGISGLDGRDGTGFVSLDKLAQSSGVLTADSA